MCLFLQKTVTDVNLISCSEVVQGAVLVLTSARRPAEAGAGRRALVIVSGLFLGYI